MSNNESKRPFADQVLEYAGVQVGDIYEDREAGGHLKVVFIGDTDKSYPVLVVGECLSEHIFINEQYITENCTLVERGGQEVVGPNNLRYDDDGDIVEIINQEGKYTATREWDIDTQVFLLQVHHEDWAPLMPYKS